MALPTSQPLPEILPGWTVARGTPADLIDGINSGIYELYGGVIGIAAGNDVAGRIIRHRIPPHESIAEGSQDCPDRAGNPSRGCRPDSRRVRRPAGRVETKHRRREAVMPPRSPQADPQPYHLKNGASLAGPVPMRGRRLMPALQRENDMGGRFTKRPSGDSQGRFHLSSVFSSVSAPVAGPATPARKSPRRTGATPLFQSPVLAWHGAGFHKRRPAPRGVAPVPESIPAGRRSDR